LKLFLCSSILAQSYTKKKKLKKKCQSYGQVFDRSGLEKSKILEIAQKKGRHSKKTDMTPEFN
jgi:hypothetical protein